MSNAKKGHVKRPERGLKFMPRSIHVSCCPFALPQEADRAVEVENDDCT